MVHWVRRTLYITTRHPTPVVKLRKTARQSTTKLWRLSTAIYDINQSADWRLEREMIVQRLPVMVSTDTGGGVGGWVVPWPGTCRVSYIYQSLVCCLTSNSGVALVSGFCLSTLFPPLSLPFYPSLHLHRSLRSYVGWDMDLWNRRLHRRRRGWPCDQCSAVAVVDVKPSKPAYTIRCQL